LLSSNTTDIGEQWEAGSYLPVARRQPGQSIERVRAALLVMSRSLRAEHPALGEKFEWGAETENVSRVSYAAAGILPVIGAVFFGLAALVLLTACVNVTSLVLTRAAGRRSELAVRQAMGASRTRLARQLLTETVLIALTGLVGAWGLAWVTIRALRNLPVGFDVPIRFELAFDARVFALASLASLAAGLLAGIAPAITGTRDGPSSALREGGGKGAAGGIRTQKFRTALVGAQVAVSVTLLTAAALFVQSTRRAARIDLGFHPERILSVTFNPGYTLRKEVEMRQAFDRILADVRALPGVESAAWASALPLFRSNFSGPVFVDDPAARTDRTGSIVASYVDVSPEFLATLDVPIVAGRGITAEDDSLHPRVALVNQRAAQLFWPGKTPIGQHLRFAQDGAPVEVVGVTRDGRYNFILEPPTPFIYLPHAQRPPGEAFLAVRASGDAHSLDAPIRAVFAAASPDFVPAGFIALSDVIHDGPNALLMFRLGAVSASVLGAVSLFLTLVGLFGVMSVGVTQRTRELGVRLALGATPSQVRRSVLRQAAALAGLGVLAGVPVALFTVTIMRSLIVGMTMRDMLVVLVVAMTLVLSAMAAAYPSALRASRLNPTGALRSD
ncbi:MAG TPA: FtsX-like permease family protein, partial [Gemmatimonadales bacterium]|nr:FtsX-like permease family protein [Gemmatimonadales bacterium]